MAALSIAFEAPDNTGSVCPSKTRPIDLVQLARQTMGDKALEQEVLHIFARQARQSMKEIAEADAQGRLAVAHRLKGAAQAVGATGVAHAAEVLEGDATNASAVAAIIEAVVEAENFILKLTR
ncbi:Hpt domain-containing protein [Sinorhizobium sp. BG8]|uniref:Hpt domain-containing protein n=1 Tax=Sinorhizobium sp. BG8 TaxID=2613773 RepID=UPI00193E9A3A|nr:Hpt domain-containing protein [Sinorhizobium sp. BG8]QRM55667.1 Hpt domain-containing protein [Sinorhizobium sp. BG8]